MEARPPLAIPAGSSQHVGLARGLGIDFIAYNDRNLDTTTPTGKLVYKVLGCVEFERDIIRQRIKAGLDNARRKGRHPGRRPKLTPKLLGKGKELRAQGMSWRKIGAELGLDEGTLRKALKGEAEGKRGFQ